MYKGWKWVVVWIVMVGVTSFPSAEKAAGMDMRKSTWLWNTWEIVSNKEEIISFLTAHGVDEVYLQVDPEVGFEDYHQFIGMASIEGIEVHALDGAPKWATVKGRASLDTFFDWVKDYQASAAEGHRFMGIHLDVEPYLLPAWTTAYGNTVLNYQRLVAAAAELSAELQLPLAMDIPFWFDEKKFNNEFGKGNVAEWVIGKTDEVAVMAYRDLANGPNGIIELVRNEIQFGLSQGKMVKVAVETAHSAEGDFLTFYEEGETFMSSELALVDERYRDYNSYNGIAVHHYGSLKNLSE